MRSVIDLRQNFLTFGDKSWGTIKVGRDLGMFGDVILSDMTLLGVGGNSQAHAYVTFGHIGTGYMYADWIPQISYTTPDWSGFQAGIGAFTGFNISGDGTKDAAGNVITPVFDQHETPMVQGKLSYSWGGPFSGKAWVNGLYQNSKSDANIGKKLDSVAVDGGFKLGFAGLDAVLYAYYGNGVGTTGIGNNALAADGSKRDSVGWFGQLTYKLGRLKPGISYGESRLLKSSTEGNGTLVYRNRDLTGGLYYNVVDSLTLVAEYNVTWSENQQRGQLQNHTASLGAILFF